MLDDSGIAGGAAFGDPAVVRGKVDGPGYAFTEEQLQALVTKWEDLADRFRNGQRRARVIAETDGPGAEYASGGNAQLVQASGKSLLDTLIARERFCREQAAKTLAAMGSYANAEDDAATGVTTQEGKF